MWLKACTVETSACSIFLDIRTVFQPRLLLLIKVLTWPLVELIKTVFLFYQDFYFNFFSVVSHTEKAEGVRVLSPVVF